MRFSQFFLAIGLSALSFALVRGSPIRQSTGITARGLLSRASILRRGPGGQLVDSDARSYGTATSSATVTRRTNNGDDDKSSNTPESRDYKTLEAIYERAEKLLKKEDVKEDSEKKGEVEKLIARIARKKKSWHEDFVIPKKPAGTTQREALKKFIRSINKDIIGWERGFSGGTKENPDNAVSAADGNKPNTS